MDTVAMLVKVPLWAHAPSACLDTQVWIPPPTARQVEEDDQPPATERGGNHRPVGQAS